MENNKREIKDAFYLMALQGLTYVAPLIVFPYLMKVLGAEKFGYIGFSLSAIQYLMLIVDFGFNLSATKKVALAKGYQPVLNKIFSATILAKTGLLAVSFLLFLILAFAIPQFSIYRSTMLIFFIMVIANTFSFVWLFQGLGKIRLVAVINGVAKLLILPLTFIFVHSENDVYIAALLQSLVFVVSALSVIAIIWKERRVRFVKVSKANVLLQLKDSFPIFTSIAATSIYTVSFVVILGYFYSPAEVGKYAAVEKLMRAFCYLVFVPVSQSFYPKISRMAQEDAALAVKTVNRILLAMGAAMIVVFAGMYFGSSLAVRFLGNDYLGTDVLFKIMAFIPFFIALGGIFGQLGLLAVGTEKDKLYFNKVYLIAGAVAFVAIFVFIPLFGVIGAAVSLLITEFTVFFLMGKGWMKLCRNM